VEVIEFGTGGHFDLIDPVSPAWEAVVTALAARLR
jgi:hypothetical protein